jgi:hypothetical protein
MAPCEEFTYLMPVSAYFRKYAALMTINFQNVKQTNQLFCMVLEFGLLRFQICRLHKLQIF